MAIVGESGSGKSVTALSILQLLPYPLAAHPSGSIRFDGQELVGRDDGFMRAIRGRRIGMIFQEPMTSLNPLHTVERQISEVLFVHRGLGRSLARARVLELHAAGADPGRRGPAGLLPAPALRRAAAAGDDRDGAGQRARHPDRRRADHRTRRHHPGADPAAAEGAADAAGHGDPADHPRPHHRPPVCRAGRRDDQGRAGRAGAGGRGVRPAAPPLHPPPAGGRAQGRAAAGRCRRRGGR